MTDQHEPARRRMIPTGALSIQIDRVNNGWIVNSSIGFGNLKPIAVFKTSEELIEALTGWSESQEKAR